MTACAFIVLLILYIAAGQFEFEELPFGLQLALVVSLLGAAWVFCWHFTALLWAFAP